MILGKGLRELIKEGHITTYSAELTVKAVQEYFADMFNPKPRQVFWTKNGVNYSAWIMKSRISMEEVIKKLSTKEYAESISS